MDTKKNEASTGDIMYKKKVSQAIKLLKSIPLDEGEIELCYSGGKDSDVILELAKMAEIPFRAIYKNTTIDPPGTIKHCKQNGVEILQPSISFFDLIKKRGMPTRRARFCCEVLKEYKVLDRAIQGIRRSESVKRHKRYREPEICRTYKKGENVKIYLPILEWTDKDVERFIQERQIRVHPLYYDEMGRFRVERRLGCIGCPLQSDNGVKEFKRYPKLLKSVIKAADIFLATHPKCKSIDKFGNAYNLVFHNLFCRTYDDYVMKTSVDLFGRQLDTKAFLETFFNSKL